MDGGWKEYFVFSRKERVAVFFLLVIIILLICIPSIIKPAINPNENIVWLPVDSVLNMKTEGYNNTGRASLATKQELLQEDPGAYKGKPIADQDAAQYELFYFDPNIASAEALRKLGIKERQVNTIQRYVSKGGRFRKAEDLGKVYGMSEDEVKRLMPFVRIKPANRPSLKNNEPNMPYHQSIIKRISTLDSVQGTRTNPGTRMSDQNFRSAANLEINSASKQDWERLPGIGATLATRIITFREKLGGFYSVLQVAETYGLPDSTYRKIMTMLTCDSSSCRKLPINQASVEQLNLHPYFRGATAAALIKYRDEHGEFKDLADLKKIKSINLQVYNRILPYTSLHPQ